MIWRQGQGWRNLTSASLPRYVRCSIFCQFLSFFLWLFCFWRVLFLIPCNNATPRDLWCVTFSTTGTFLTGDAQVLDEIMHGKLKNTSLVIAEINTAKHHSVSTSQYIFVLSMQVNIWNKKRPTCNSVCPYQDNIRIFHGCSLLIEKSVPRITVWHHDALPSDAEQIFSIFAEHPW